MGEERGQYLVSCMVGWLKLIAIIILWLSCKAFVLWKVWKFSILVSHVHSRLYYFYVKEKRDTCIPTSKSKTWNDNLCDSQLLTEWANSLSNPTIKKCLRTWRCPQKEIINYPPNLGYSPFEVLELLGVWTFHIRYYAFNLAIAIVST